MATDSEDLRKKAEEERQNAEVAHDKSSQYDKAADESEEAKRDEDEADRK